MAHALKAGYHLKASLALPNGGPGGTGAAEYVFIRGTGQCGASGFFQKKKPLSDGSNESAIRAERLPQRKMAGRGALPAGRMILETLNPRVSTRWRPEDPWAPGQFQTRPCLPLAKCDIHPQ